MENGFMYLYAIIDVYSRYIVSWGLYNTLDGANAIEVLDRAVARFGAPEIINSDQGVQYNCKEWHRACKKMGYLSVWTAGQDALTMYGLNFFGAR